MQVDHTHYGLPNQIGPIKIKPITFEADLLQVLILVIIYYNNNNVSYYFILYYIIQD